MEDPAIIRMNLERYRRLLAVETNAAKRPTILKPIRETEAKLQDPHPPNDAAAARVSEWGLPQMTAPTQAAVDSKDALSAEEGCASVALGHPSETRAAAVHELCERLTAIGNYIASAVRLPEIDPAALARPPPRLTEALNKALSQVDQAAAVINRYRNLLAKESKMGSEREQAIQERAIVLWEQDGHPDGKDLEFWLRAEAEILDEPYAGVTDNGKVVVHSRTGPLATSPKRPSPG